METDDETLLELSFSFISENVNVLSDEIPDYLIDYWTLDEFNLETVEGVPQFTIFFYSLLKYKWLQDIKEFKMPIDDIYNLFKKWQTFLVALNLELKTDVVVKPFKLFDFDNYENSDLVIFDN